MMGYEQWSTDAWKYHIALSRVLGSLISIVHWIVDRYGSLTAKVDPIENYDRYLY